MTTKTSRINTSSSLNTHIIKNISTQNNALLRPTDVEDTLKYFSSDPQFNIKVTMLDPWYNKGVGGVRDDYVEYITRLLHLAARVSPHVFLWGFPEIVARFIERLPDNLKLNAWLTWFYKNNPSVIRGWRSSQMACLHLTREDAVLYPEHFLNAAQKELELNRKLRYMPGPTSVIEAPLLVGFVGKKEQTGHPSQKSMLVYETLYKMSTQEGDLVLDPMCGSGTTGAVAKLLGFNSILSDISEEYTSMVEKRLGIKRLPYDIPNLKTSD